MTIVLTKVRAPQRRKDVLRRVRLVDTLHQNLHRKLTFVSAPAGYGKTTLLIDFADDVDATVCWYRIGPEDSDLVQFVQHIVASFQQNYPGFGEALEERLNSPSSAPDSPSLATELINEIERQVQDFTVLVLDDYHLAGENQQIVDLLENLLEHLPDQLRILIGSRSVYGIPTANLYIRDELVTISADELRFRADELQKLVLQNYRMRLSQDEAEELAKRADGWIIAILLAVRAMENGAMPKFSGAMEQVYAYLAEEVVNRQSEELRDFMLAASILNDFNEQLCNYLMERKDSSLFLRSLEERNLFVSRTETKNGNSYRFHQLFSEFLQDYFRRHDPARMRKLHARAAEWHQNREEWELAIDHKTNAGERQEAAGWMDVVAGPLYASDRQRLLARWVGELAKAPDMRRYAPRLLLYQAKSLVNQSRFSESIELLDLAEPELAKQDDMEILANAQITRGMVERFTRNPKQAIKSARSAKKLLEEQVRHGKESRQWFQAERLEGISNFYVGNVATAIEHLNLAVAGLRELVDASEAKLKAIYLYDLAECLNDLGLIYITTGQMLNAQTSYQEALDIHIRIRSNLGALANARNNIAYLNHQVGHYPEAWREYSLALENARAANRAREQIAILSGRGELLVELEEYEEAQTNYEQAVALGTQANEMQELVSVFVGMARIQKSKQEYNEAMNLLRRAATLGNGHFDPNQYAVELGQIYLDMGQQELALTQFAAAGKSWEVGNSPTQAEVLATFQSARIEYGDGKREKAYELLERVLQGAAQLGYDQFIVATGKSSADFLTEAAEYVKSAQAINLAQRASEFRTGKIMLEPAVEAEEIAPTGLEVQTLGAGDVRKNGELIPAAEWRSNRARALFFYILDQGRVRKEAIGLDFWADFSPAKVSSNFHATLWRVRQALGFKDSILFENDHYCLHPSISIWYDVNEFLNYVRQAASSSISSVERSELLRQAARLYNGPYLPDVYMEWADKRREELRGLYLDALVGLAKIESQNNRFAEAKELYEKIVALDPYRDETHLALMKCQVEIGSKSAAIAHYKRYKALLRKELNAEPMPELEGYFNQLALKA